MHSLLLLLFTTLLLLVPAMQAADRVECFPNVDAWCDTDPQKMREAIELIPDPDPGTSSSQQQQNQLPAANAAAYRVPAIFQASENAQIYISLTQSSGLVLDPDTLMAKLWPNAKRAAMRIYNECVLPRGLTGWMQPELEWEEGSPPKKQKLVFLIVESCKLSKARVRGVTTYTPSGVEAAPRIGAGQPIDRWWGFGST